MVVEDRVALRAEPRDSARQHALLWQGDSVEIRGRRFDFLQVYDYRRERGGYVRADQLRLLNLQPEAAADLMAVVRFLEFSPGNEALGVAYAAAFLRAAPAKSIGAEAFSALGRFADRLAYRVSNARRSNDETLSAHLEVVAHYGVRIRSFERAGRMQLCYDGDAFRRVLALPASAEQQVDAALSLTRPECVDPDLTPLERHLHDDWRTQVLARVDETELPEHIRNRLRMRKAAVWASVAFQRSRRGEPTEEAAELARQSLVAVDLRALSERDRDEYEEAAVRVGASRWAADLGLPQKGGPQIVLQAGNEPGQTCVRLHGPAASDGKPGNLLTQRCTFATVWPQSARLSPANDILALAVQPLDGWRELWLFQESKDGWQIDVLPPEADTPDLGYIEFAGWVPRSRKILTAREFKQQGRWMKQYELRSLDSLQVEKHADDPSHLSIFYRNQDVAWKKQSLALR
ncbi:hypothetical protein IFO71_20565 [Pseudoxanthomonas sp. CAU 1598]|uniref:SH3 domain-containing protein n=1 Tax=Pseudomarimonas arenosa TaxID=2774145 RepID=A0AAW3ZUN6_9GAMM|nr:hypothetical protein [Pseudomarimonas arenosa]